jgi:hypothetical protein
LSLYSGRRRVITGVGISGQGLLAICYSDGSVVHLELLADEKPVLSVTDATFAGRSFRPAIVVQGPVDIDVLHLALSTL